MGNRDDASGRVDPKRIGSDQFNPQTLANTRTVDTLLPYAIIMNGDSVQHTITLELRQGNGPSFKTSFTIAAGGACGLPTLGIAAVSCDSAGTNSSVVMWYTDVEPAGFKTGAGSPTVSNQIIVGLFRTGPTAALWYAGPNVGDANTPTHASVSKLYITRAGTLKLFAAYWNPIGGVGNGGTNITFTLEKNGVDTALTFTFSENSPAGVAGVDSTHTVAVAVGDLIDCKLDFTGGVANLGTTSIVLVAEFDPS